MELCFCDKPELPCFAEGSAHFKSKVLKRIRAIRDGRLNDARFGSRMRGQGIYATQIHDLFELARKRHGFSDERPALSAASFRRPSDAQLSLFE